MTGWLQPHRIVMILLGLGLVAWCIVGLRWDWVPKYAPLMVAGVWRTIWILVVTNALGMLLAIPLGLAQAAGPWYLATPARMFCSVIRGTPLLLSLDPGERALALSAAGLALCGAGTDAELCRLRG